MIPITIETKTLKMSTTQLQDTLEHRAYEFCVLADFSKTEAVGNMCASLEQLTVEALMRIFDHKLGYRPLQNKLYEKTEFVFNDQDAYNINRLVSSLRRVKMYPINEDDVKYIEWLSNRVKYATYSIISTLNTVKQCENDEVSYETNDN